MSKGDVGIPSYYTPVEYIESSGTQYIDTGYVPKANTKFVLDCNVTQNTQRGYEALFGCRTGSYQTQAYNFFSRFSSNNVPCYNRSGAETTGSNMIYGQRITLTTLGQTATWTNGVDTYSVTTTGTANDCAYSLFLFNLSSSGSPDSSYSVMKLYSFKVYEDDVLARDFIPILDENNVECLYEKVEGKFYYNKGTGTFTAGSATGQPVSLGDKARRIKKGYVGIPHAAIYYTPIEYIESTGTQYINTGYKPNQNVGIEIDFTMLSMSGNYVSPFGAGSANTNRFSANNYSGFTGGEFYTGSTGHAAYMEANVREQITYKNKVFSDSKGHTYTTTNTFTCTESLALFGCGTSTGAQWLSQTRIYSCKLYDGDTLIRDFIPVLDENNKACLYEKLSHEFYYNKGTGEFTAGSATGLPIYRDWGILKLGFVGIRNSYTPVEYIESSGTQYIDTGYKPNGNTKYELVSGEVASAGVMFGAYNSTWTTGSGFYSNAGSNPDYVHYYSNTNTDYTQSGGYNLEIDKGKVTINNTVYVNATTASFNVTYPLYLFAGNMAGTIEQRTSFKLYSFKIYDDGILVRDFIPVVDDNNVACLWDKVEQKAYYNAGSGTFTAGSATGESDIVVSKARVCFSPNYTRVEYIQSPSASSGATYIDTGLKAHPNTVTIIDFSLVDITTEVGQYGTPGWDDTFNYCLYTNNSQDFYLRYGSYNNYIMARSYSRFSIKIDGKNKKLYVGDTQKLDFSSATTAPESTNNMYIFSGNYSLGRAMKAKLYGCKIYEDDVLLRDFIPVKDENGVACLFDLVTHKLFYNGGTTTLTAGPEI